MKPTSIEAKKKLAELIYTYIRGDFPPFYSANLKRTMRVTKVGDDYKVLIPAVKYDKKIYDRTGAIVYRPERGSYAQLINITGGYSGSHVNYVENGIERAIKEWLGWLGVKSTSVKTM